MIRLRKYKAIKMVRRLYPLNALRAFEAAGRHLSFVKAAEELHVTPGAVSHQVKGLEEFLRVQLFRRLPQRVLLTDVGQAFLAELRECFARVDRAVERVLESDALGPLAVGVAPAFAAALSNCALRLALTSEMRALTSALGGDFTAAR